MKHRVRLGLALGDYPRPPGGDADLFATVVAQVRAAERSGFDSVWVPDHLMQTPVVAPPDDPMLECFTTLGALAMITSRVYLGALVGCAGYRNPTLAAKAVTTLDVISGGRAIFGIGAGWFETEHVAYGYDFGSTADRFARLRETLDIACSMFGEDETSYQGHHYRAAAAINQPRPLREGGPPILVGGSGERRTLPLVAEYADLCNFTGGPARLRHLLGVLAAQCERIGRDPGDICSTFINVVVVRDTEAEARAALPAAYRDVAAEVADHLSDTVRPICGTREQVVEQLRNHLTTGIDGMVLSCAGGDRNADYVEMLGELALEAQA